MEGPRLCGHVCVCWSLTVWWGWAVLQVRTVALMHARGLVLGDLKPGNIVFFTLKWKLIDLDGCVGIGDPLEGVTYQYCPPEAAVSLSKGEPPVAAPAFDSWSLGMVSGWCWRGEEEAGVVSGLSSHPVCVCVYSCL